MMQGTERDGLHVGIIMDGNVIDRNALLNLKK